MNMESINKQYRKTTHWLFVCIGNVNRSESVMIPVNLGKFNPRTLLRLFREYIIGTLVQTYTVSDQLPLPEAGRVKEVLKRLPKNTKIPVVPNGKEWRFEVSTGSHISFRMVPQHSQS